MNNNSIPSASGSPTRRRFSEMQITTLLDEFQGSGLSAAAFSRQRGLCYSAFRRWCKQRGLVIRRGSPRFRSLPLGALLGTSWAAEIALPDGSALRVQERVSPLWAAALLQELRRSC